MFTVHDIDLEVGRDEARVCGKRRENRDGPEAERSNAERPSMISKGKLLNKSFLFRISFSS
jgi:hypothetical protein